MGNDEQILRQRASALARPAEARARGDEQLLIAFSRAGQRYAVEARWVQEVAPVEGLVPLPGLPPFVLGILPMRGQVQTVLDLPPMLGLAAGAEPPQMLVVEAGGRQTCLAVDAVHGAYPLDRRAIQQMRRSGSAGEEFILGSTAEGVTVVSIPALVASPRLALQGEDG